MHSSGDSARKMRGNMSKRGGWVGVKGVMGVHLREYCSECNF